VKKIAVLPTLLTLGNGICGLAGVAMASRIGPAELPEVNNTNFALAGWFILFGMVFDMLDGYVARLSKTASDFGGELDSLCDVVTFGVTPAFLLLKLGPSKEANEFLHMVLAGIAGLYFACTALRLARFNVANDTDPASHKRFKGLPSPGAAGCIAGLAILRGQFANSLATRWPSFVDADAARAFIERGAEIAAPVCALIVALLMVSNISYPHATNKIFRGKKTIGHLIQVLLAVFILVALGSLAPLFVFWIYAFLFPLRALVARNLRAETTTVDEHAPHQL
jgi:CDP-diacylglycerol---serine O-phosphatidyltransferase